MHTEVMTITPEIAIKMLSKNTSNRPLNQKHIAFLVRDIKAGRWKLNGDAIRFGENALLDGQHRLLLL